MKTLTYLFLFGALVACTADDGVPTSPPEGASTPVPPPASAAPGTANPIPTSSPPPAPTPPPDVGDAAVVPSNRVRGLVGVGYGGLRITSRDGGKTWTSRTSTANAGGDDFNLLRAVAYANGKWLAVGWGATTSADGVTWTPIARINQAAGVTWRGAPSCGLVEGLTSDGAAFYAACAAYGQAHELYRSTDAETWSVVGTIGQVGGHPALDYRAGVFFAYGDPGTSFRSTDGVTWTQAPGLVQATYCDGQWKSKSACRDAIWFGGAYFQSIWQSKVSRSEGMGPFVVVHDDVSTNTLYQPRAMAEGLVAR